MPREAARVRVIAAAAFRMLVILFIVRPAFAYDAQLTWSAVSGAAGYKVYVRQSTQLYGQGTNVGGVVQYVVTGLPNTADNHFAVTAYNASGTESPLSNELSLPALQTPTSTPTAPAALPPTARAPGATRTSTATPTPTSPPQAPVGCGDGVRSGTEECDDGNLVSGDGCSAVCRSELIPGGNAAKTDCVHEWLTDPVPPRGANGIPTNLLQCTDDDPQCDFGAPGDLSCTFHVALCFNVPEVRFNCSPTDVATVQLKSPKEAQPKDSAEAFMRDTLEHTLATVGGVARGLCANRGSQKGQLCVSDSDCGAKGVCKGRFISFSPALTTLNTCSAFAEIEVPLEQTVLGLRKGTKLISLDARPSNDPLTGKKRPKDSDSLKLICNPHQ